MIEREIDETTGIIHVTGSGRWTLAEVDSHFLAFAALIAARRAAGHQIRVLSDVTQAEVQLPAVEARINAHSANLYQPEDRVALVVKTSILKQHIRSHSASRGSELFCSRDAARMWLTAYDQRLSA